MATQTTSTAVPSKVINEFADMMAALSVWVFNFRRKNILTPADEERLRNLEDSLDQMSIRLRADSIKILGEESKVAVDQLKAATARANEFLDKVKEIKETITMITKVLAVAAAVMVGDAQGLITALKAFVPNEKKNPGTKTATDA